MCHDFWILSLKIQCLHFCFFCFFVSRKRMPLTDWCGLSRFIFEPSDRQNRILEHLIHLGACHCGYLSHTFLTLELSPRDHNSISYRATNKNSQKTVTDVPLRWKNHNLPFFSSTSIIFSTCVCIMSRSSRNSEIFRENFGQIFFGLELVWVWWTMRAGSFFKGGLIEIWLIPSLQFTFLFYVFGRNNDSKIHKIQKKSSGCPKSSGTADTPHCFHYCVHV